MQFSADARISKAYLGNDQHYAAGQDRFDDEIGHYALPCQRRNSSGEPMGWTARELTQGFIP